MGRITSAIRRLPIAAILIVARFASAGAQTAPPVAVPLPVSTDAGCLIVSDFGAGAQKNFETLVLQGHDLVHYWHDNSNVATGWVRGQVISRAATGPGCLIQSDFKSSSHGNFEVVVPEGKNLVHYFHDNSDVSRPWQRAQVISAAATGPASLIQSDFKSGGHGNFELVVPEGHDLVHYFHDNSDVSRPWQRAQVISTAATGPASLIQTDFKSGGHGNFELVVLEGRNLVHYFHDNSNVALPWRRGQIISTGATGPGTLIQSDFKSGDHGNFEVLVHEGGRLVHYFHDNSDVTLPWRRGEVVAEGVGGTTVGLVQGRFGSPHGNFEVAALTGDAVRHFWHDNRDVALPWQPGLTIAAKVRSQKVCQLTGDTDLQTGAATSNRTLSRFHVGGTDLGYPFENQGRLSFAFGDTAGSVADGRDSLAFTTDAEPEPCPHLTFVADGDTFRPIAAPGVSLAYFEVPTTGFSANGALYLFVWTDHKDLFNGSFSNPVGHAALLRSRDEGRSFELVWDRLGDQLVYLSAAVVDTASVQGLPPAAGQTLLLWGSGKLYRQSNVHLAAIPLDGVEDRSKMRFFNGTDAGGRPVWGTSPDPDPQRGQLFDQACVGELSVVWNAALRRWLMTYNCSNPSGINARLAPTPWGPWSAPSVLFDAAVDDGSCFFIRGPGDCGPPKDPFSPAGASPGGVYAPYVIPRYTRTDQHTTTLYYTMSTWNPYQVVLMRTTLAVPAAP